MNHRPETNAPLLQVKDVILKIQDTQILNSTTFEIPSNQTVGIIGPNGSGKTTLFNCINGFMPMTSGQVIFKGVDISKLPAFQRSRKGLGRVFQNFGVFREMTLLENVIIAIETHHRISATLLPWGKLQRQTRLEALTYLEQVGLQDKARDRASSLSGGQMRLLEIIRSVAFGSELLLLDEPTAGVSPKMKDNVAELILRVEKMGKTIMIIEHDINFIQRFCKRVIVLDGGRVVLDDSPEKVRSDRRLQEIYFGNERKEAATG